MSEFKVGDKVELREDSRWNDGAIQNPIGVSGVIISINLDPIPVGVSWGNGYTNSYDHKDLKPWGATKSSEKTYKDFILPDHKFKVSVDSVTKDGKVIEFDDELQLDFDEWVSWDRYPDAEEEYTPAEEEEGDEEAEKPELPPCCCDMKVLLRKGCQCGGV